MLLSICFKEHNHGAPSVVQWVKNMTVAAQVASEAQSSIPSWCSGVKDLALPQLRLKCTPWPGNFHVPWVQLHKIKIKEHKHEKIDFSLP